MLNNFINFVREKGVIGLAVGLVIGNAVTKLVNTIVDSTISPIISWISGAAGNLNELSYTVPLTTITFKWGALVSGVIDFLAIMLIIYFVFVKSPLNKLDKPKS